MSWGNSSIIKRTVSSPFSISRINVLAMVLHCSPTTSLSSTSNTSVLMPANILDELGKLVDNKEDRLLALLHLQDQRPRNGAPLFPDHVPQLHFEYVRLDAANSAAYEIEKLLREGL